MLSENVTMIPRYSIARQRIAQFTLEDQNGPVLPPHPYRNVDQTLGCCPLSPLWKMTGRAELRHDWVFHCRYNTPNTPQTLNINPLPSLSILYPLSSTLFPRPFLLSSCGLPSAFRQIAAAQIHHEVVTSLPALLYVQDPYFDAHSFWLSTHFFTKRTMAMRNSENTTTFKLWAPTGRLRCTITWKVPTFQISVADPGMIWYGSGTHSLCWCISGSNFTG